MALNDEQSQDHREELFFMGPLSIKDKNLTRRRKNDWVEDTFIDYSDDQLHKANKQFLGLALSQQSLNVFLLLLFVGIGLLFGRSAYLQVITGEEYRSVAESNRLRIYHIESPRGIIFDRNGISMVKNVPSFSLLITPIDFPDEESERESMVSWIMQNSEEDIEPAIDQIIKIDRTRKEYYQPQVVVDNIPYEKAIELQVASARLPGVSVAVTTQRQYLPVGNSADPEFPSMSMAHLLGYVGKVNSREYENLKKDGYLFNDVVGKTGIEQVYESTLRGIYGRKQIEVDSLGKELKVIAQDDVKQGDNLVMSIDLIMQSKLESLMRATLEEKGLEKAVGIIQDPSNGQVLAMVSWPSYDNNLFARGIDQESYQSLLNDDRNPLFSRAVSGEYPSGSTIKPMVAAAALQEGIISSTTTFLSTGGIRIGQWFFPDWRGGGHGVTDVRKALADSVNTFFYIIGGGWNDFDGLGVRKIKEYGEMFGLGQQTGVDLPHEQDGFLPTPEWKQEFKDEIWYIGDTYHAAIGQGDVLVTPLQVNNYIAAVANGGTLYRPQMIKGIVKAGSENEDPVFSEVLNENFIDRDNMSVIRQGMRQAVTSGSAVSLNSLPVSSAGKTGTAQWTIDEPPHAWFTAFAPYEQPELVMTVLVEEGEEGSKVSVPIVREFFQWYFQEYQQ